MNISENSSNDKTYNMTKTNMAILSMIAIFAMFVGFSLNFSIERKLVSTISGLLKNNNRCPINFNKISISYFLPSLNISELNIDGNCFQSSDSLTINKFKVSPGFPSLSPLGFGFTTLLEDSYSKLSIISVHGINKHRIYAESEDVNSKTFSPFLSRFKFNANFSLNTNVLLSNMKMTELSLLVKSKNLKIPSQNINGLELPELKIKNLQIKASAKNDKSIELEEVIIGDEQSPIRASITGNIGLNKLNISRSRLDLIINVKFSSSFLESFPILNLLLDQSKQDAQGFYKMSITGTMDNPSKPKFL